jgi:glycosyltransferase involved in cell wall biosynthesis
MERLPTVLYIADVPVESSYHGSLLLHRLLDDYPGQSLLVVEGNLNSSKPERRLKGVQYKSLRVGWERLLRTRLHKVYSAFLARTAASRAGSVAGLIGGFDPAAILTVSHGFSWITAATFAEMHHLPLHLICHDDWPRMASLPMRTKAKVDKVFGRVYRQAISRFCVSPFMRDAYLQRYHAGGEVLYPSRGKETPLFDEPPPAVPAARRPLTVAFAGTINTPGYMRAVAQAAECIDALHGRFLIFGPVSRDGPGGADLNRANVELRGLLSSADLVRTLRAEADLLLVPISFDGVDRSNMELNFPSKLVDYTATGLPLLIYGPEYCSAVRWASENAGSAEVVDREGLDLLRAALKRLLENPILRRQLGARALEVGKLYFSYEKAEQLFFRALRAGRP